MWLELPPSQRKRVSPAEVMEKWQKSKRQEAAMFEMKTASLRSLKNRLNFADDQKIDFVRLENEGADGLDLWAQALLQAARCPDQGISGGRVRPGHVQGNARRRQEGLRVVRAGGHLSLQARYRRRPRESRRRRPRACSLTRTEGWGQSQRGLTRHCESGDRVCAAHRSRTDPRSALENALPVSRDRVDRTVACRPVAIAVEEESRRVLNASGRCGDDRDLTALGESLLADEV